MASSWATVTPEFPSGALAPDSQLYVERPPIETLCSQNIEVPGSLTRIKGPRQMGKSSLLLRIMGHGKALGYQTAFIDFQAAEADLYSDLSRFLRWFCQGVAQQLGLPPRLDEFWDEELGSKLSATLYFSDYLLASSDRPILLALNELNQVFEYRAIAQDFLSLLRFWYEQAKLEPAYQKLRTIIVHSTDIYVSLNIHQSPFNVGLPIQLTHFDEAQVQELGDRYGLELSRDQKESLMSLVGGHPYLLSIAFYHLSQRQLSWEALIQQAPTSTSIYAHYLRGCLSTLQQQPTLLETLRWVLKSPGPIEVSTTHAHQLVSLGLVKMEGNLCESACELYRLFFNQSSVLASPQEIRFHQLEAENEQLRALANIDGLTQVANRRFFDSQLQYEWQRASLKKTSLSLILLDIDYFKLYNDAFGHIAGDECLRQVAKILQTKVRHLTDTVARYGGEEFAVILPHTNAKMAVQFAQRIQTGLKALRIAHPSSKNDDKVLTLSMGVACLLPNFEQDCEALVAAADAALYEAKRQGRDRVSVSQQYF